MPRGLGFFRGGSQLARRLLHHDQVTASPGPGTSGRS
jgi:hypothetical protein